MCLGCTSGFTEAHRRSGLVLAAALVHDPRHVEPMRRTREDISRRLDRDGLAPGVGEAVRLAIDGLWFGWIFGINELTPGRLRTTLEALTRLVDLSPDSHTPTRPTPGPAKRRPSRESPKS